MKVSYNSPVVLNFTVLAVVVYLLTHVLFPPLLDWFVTYPSFNFLQPLSYFRLFSHVLGHANLSHLIGNFTYILLLGPILEEKYGSQNLIIMILLTAVITSILNMMFMNAGLLGASGIVFLFIMLASFTSFRSGEIPLTFILVFGLFIGQELLNGFKNDQISQFAHILGGIIGSIFGFNLNKK